MSEEILLNGVGKQTTVFYYNFLQAAYQSKASGNTSFFPKYLRCTNKTIHTMVSVFTGRHGVPPCGQVTTSLSCYLKFLDIKLNELVLESTFAAI